MTGADRGSPDLAPLGPGARALQQFRRRRSAVGGAAVLLVIVLAVLVAPLLSKHDPLARDAEARLSPPGALHPMGTDSLGRDVMSRVLHGGRISLLVGFLAVASAALVGVPLGLVSGYAGGKLDGVVMRAMDLVLSFPGMIFAIWLVALMGPGLRNTILAIAFYSVPTYARVSRASVLSVREMDYIAAERCIGAGPVRIVFRHLLPNIQAPLIVLLTLDVSGAILAGAGLSFLGLGARPPTPEWGAMLSDGRAYLRTAWWMSLFPGMAITTVVLCANLVGDGLRAALDPRTR